MMAEAKALKSAIVAPSGKLSLTKAHQGRKKRPEGPASIVAKPLRCAAHPRRIEFRHERAHRREFHQEDREERDAHKQKARVAHRNKHVDEDHHQGTHRRPHEGPFPADGVAQIGTQQKTQERAQNLNEEKPSGGGSRQPAHRAQVGRHPEAERVAAALGAGDHQGDFDCGPQMRLAKSSEQMAEADRWTSAPPGSENLWLVDMPADPEDQNCGQKADREQNPPRDRFR
jgi:hypothetical protein